MADIKILSKKDIETLFTKTSPKKDIVHGDIINKLKSGEGFLLNIEDFKKIMKTPIQTYYTLKYRKSDNDIIEIKKVGESYLIRKK